MDSGVPRSSLIPSDKSADFLLRILRVFEPDMSRSLFF